MMIQIAVSGSQYAHFCGNLWQYSKCTSSAVEIEGKMDCRAFGVTKDNACCLLAGRVCHLLWISNILLPESCKILMQWLTIIFFTGIYCNIHDVFHRWSGAIVTIGISTIRIVCLIKIDRECITFNLIHSKI